MKKSFKNLFGIYANIIILNIFAFTLLYSMFPKLQYFLFSEDKLVENLSGLFFLLSFIIGTLFLIQLKGRKERWIYLAIPLLGLIGFLEELSWGHRIFHFKLPYLFGIHFDSLHDINMPLFKLLTEQGESPLYILLAIFFFVSLILLLKYHKHFLQIPEILRKYPSFGLIIIASSFLLSAQVFDLELAKPQFFEALEEIFEMNGAFTWLFASFLIGYGKQSHKSLEQSARRFEKKFPVLVGIILIAFFLLGSTSYFILSAYTNKLELENREYVDKMIPLIFSSWNAEAMVSNMPSEFSTKTFKTKVEISFASYKNKLGKLISHKIVRDNLKLNKLIVKQTSEVVERNISFQSFVQAEFQKGYCNLNILTFLINKKWYLYYIELKQQM